MLKRIINTREDYMLFMGKIKATEAIEKERLQLWNDYQRYLEVENSEKLKEYLILKEKVESVPFLEKKKEIESLRFKGSPEEKELKEFSRLKKNSKLQLYFEVVDSTDLNRFHAIKESGQLEQLSELETYVKSKFKAARSEFKRQLKQKSENPPKWENTEAYNKKKAFEDLKASADVLFYKRYIKSKPYKNYLKVKGSSALTQYMDLVAEVESDKFKERRAYLEDTKRYEKTDDFKTMMRFKELDSDSDIQLYMKYNDTDDFKFFREWSLTLDEDFSTIDPERWSYTTPIGVKGPGRNFSMQQQLQYANNSDNFDVENGILTLESKKEKVDGLYWDEKFGFIPKTFDYASGIIHSVGLFEQEYGHFEVKLKASKIKGVLSSVCLVDADEEICIRILSTNGGSMSGGVITTDHQTKNYDQVRLKYPSKGYMIVAIDWTREKIEWSINEKPMGTISHSIPHIPLGLRIETEVLKETSHLPHRLDIDWIKCYKKN